MRWAIEEAELAAARGEVPVGAVVMQGSTIVARAGNQRESTGDPTAHAEIVAIRAAAESVTGWRLDDMTIYVTLEPCPMCAGALLAARVGRFGLRRSRSQSGACGSLYNLCVDPRLTMNSR